MCASPAPCRASRTAVSTTGATSSPRPDGKAPWSTGQGAFLSSAAERPALALVHRGRREPLRQDEATFVRYRPGGHDGALLVLVAEIGGGERDALRLRRRPGAAGAIGSLRT